MSLGSLQTISVTSDILRWILIFLNPVQLLKRRYIDGKWIERKDVPAALNILKKRRDRQFLADKVEYEERLKMDSDGGLSND